MLSKEQKSQIKMSMNDKWHLVKLTHVWPDGHLINQMAHALIERNAELLSLREQLAAINGAQEPVGFVKCDPCAEDCRWDCVDPIYLAGSVTPEGYGSDYFEVYRHPAPLKE
ncbi:TPA: hypothetical protein PXP82_000698 [Yersinia enterocolitica]|nr:hypothetical protein [Yersinia enterocolitica]